MTSGVGGGGPQKADERNNVSHSCTEQFQVLPDGGGAVQERCGTREMGRAHDGGALGLQEVRTMENQLNQKQGLAKSLKDRRFSDCTADSQTNKDRNQLCCYQKIA